MLYYVRRIDHLSGERLIVPGASFPSMDDAKTAAAEMMANERTNGLQSTFDVIPAILVPKSQKKHLVTKAVRAAKKSLLALGFRDVYVKNLLIINQ